MPAFESWICVIGNFVLLVAAGFENFHRPFEDPRFLFGIVRKFASLMPPKKLSVFLERQAIGRNMFGSQADGLVQTLLPRFDGLAWNPEHQVEIQIGESGLPQNIEGTLGLLRRVNTAETIQHFRIPGLDSHADAI